MTEQLKPCPFCGGIAKAYKRTCDQSDRYDPGDRAFPIVRCGSCGCCAEGKDWTELDTAIEAWNRRDQPAQVGAEPVAWLFQNEETGLTKCVDVQQVECGFEKNNPRWQKIAPLYTRPPARVPLSDGEKSLIWARLFGPDATIHTKLHGSYVRRDSFDEVVRALEAAHGIGGGK